MSNSVVELAKIRLASGKTETDLLNASTQFQKDFLDGHEGFIRRELVRSAPNEYIDIVHWQSQAHADAVMEKAQTSEAVAAYFSVMDFDSGAVDEAVTHCVSLQSHEVSAA